MCGVNEVGGDANYDKVNQVLETALAILSVPGVWTQGDASAFFSNRFCAMTAITHAVSGSAFVDGSAQVSLQEAAAKRLAKAMGLVEGDARSFIIVNNDELGMNVARIKDYFNAALGKETSVNV